VQHHSLHLEPGCDLSDRTMCLIYNQQSASLEAKVGLLEGCGVADNTSVSRLSKKKGQEI
jgi:hypothetical protein